MNIEHLDEVLNTPHAADTERQFGRLPSVDFRDRKFLMSGLEEKEITRTSRFWIAAKPLDQGRTSLCVAYAGEQLLLSSPVKNKFYKTPAELYNECQKVDEWEGEDYNGTSVRALFKVLKEQGYISEYRWAFSLAPVVNHLINVGPVVFGTTWTSGMFKPDDEGFIHVTGNSVGGHAYLLVGLNLEKKCPDGSTGAVRILNSWGSDWAQKGRAWLSLVDAAKLISDFGECGTADELKFKATSTEQ